MLFTRTDNPKQMLDCVRFKGRLFTWQLRFRQWGRGLQSPVKRVRFESLALGSGVFDSAYA